MSPVVTALSLALVVINIKAGTPDSSLCSSIWLTVADHHARPPPETYVLSSETYTLAALPGQTFGLIPPNPPITNLPGPIPSYPNFWNPTVVIIPPIVTTPSLIIPTLPPILQSLLISKTPTSPNPLPTIHPTTPVPPYDRTTTQLAGTRVSTQEPQLAQTSSFPDPVSCFGNICPAGECCSQYNYCGTTSDFCGIGCQPEGGICWSPIQSSSLLAPLPALTSTTPTASPVPPGNAACDEWAAPDAGVCSIPDQSTPLANTPAPSPSPIVSKVPPPIDMTSTIIVPSSTPSPSPIPRPDYLNCDASYTTPQSGTWHEIFFGKGVTESPVNPGNPNNTPPVIGSGYSMDLQTSITYACLVVEYCLEFGYANILESIDLHLVEVSGDTVYWECVGYPKNVGSGNYFTVSNSSVLVTYGYDLTLPVASSAAVDIIPATSTQAPPLYLPSSTALGPSPTPCIAPTALAYHNCASTFTPSNDEGNSWNQVFYGSCATEDPNNPGNSDAGVYPPLTQEYAPGPIALMQDVSCSILDDCTNWAYGQYYENIDLHLLQDSPSEAHWGCVAYYSKAQGNYFDVQNANVLLAFGYDFVFSG
ncbi:uncharacterized protein LY89DRAFT_726064 [Mollisia scopiformis]|uniref:Chitin-binding type-1 domain-containing protein n=1 Tax=Mollisia scopiformis TaxID=149040 RepID=A0A132B5I0_MOLSC|nr:uncharacterized protein LY89DRAFT_726064 [Mollisia scopiformis]KUJ06927.1 hypothetical protein LY89DRAFT_726064 [Mollisia scopiformis]